MRGFRARAGVPCCPDSSLVRGKVAFLRTSPPRSGVVRAMDAHAYLLLVALGSALVGMWIAVRLEWATPKTARGAGLCVVAAWLLPGVVGPLFIAALSRMPATLAILVAVFPVLVVMFALTAFALRYFVGLLGSAGAR